MANNNFFDEDQQPMDNQDENTQETIKLGDKEYTQEDLQRFVGLGEQAADLETRWSTKLDRLMPEYTRTRQQLAEMEKTRQEPQNQPQNNQSQDDLRRQAQAQLRDLGYLPESEVRQLAAQVTQETLAGYRLLNETEGLISKMKEDGFPSSTAEDLLLYMDQNGIKSPDKAYRLMFEPEIDKIKEQRIQSLRPQGLTTISSSNAGGKTPEPVRTTKDNLEQVLLDALRTGRG